MNSPQLRKEDLSDEQICALLSGDAGFAPDSEVAAEAASLQAALTSYRTETLLWAERRSAAMPSLAPMARRQRWLVAVPQWTLAAVAVMTVAIGVVHFNNVPRETTEMDRSATVTRTVETTAATPGEIADDNALLSSIDAAVHAGTGVPVTALGLDATHATGRTHGSME